MLGQHPELYGLPEVHLFGAETVNEFLTQCDEASYRMADGLNRAVAQLCCGAQTEATVAHARGWIARRAHFTTGLLFEALATRVHPLRLLDKSPSLVYQPDALRRVRRLFPEARFIHLVRHPIGHGQSVLNYIEDRARVAPMLSNHWLHHLAAFPFQFDDASDATFEETDPQRGWYALNKTVVDFLAELPASNWMRVRGEDLLGASDASLAEVARWLGVRSDRHAINEMKHPERSPYACYGPPSARFGNDRLFIASPALRPERAVNHSLVAPMPWLPARNLHPRVVALAREFGYS